MAVGEANSISVGAGTAGAVGSGSVTPAGGAHASGELAAGDAADKAKTGAGVSAAWRALPNYLTGSRVVFAVVFFVLLTLWRYDGSAAAAGRVDWLLVAAAGLFIVAALTDILDGYLARRWNATTAFGRIMDPFADKLLIIGALVFLAGPDFWLPLPTRDGLAGHGLQLSGVYPWMVVVIVGRELLVTSIRGTLEAQGIRFPADVFGKLKMLLQSIAIPTALLTIAVTEVRLLPAAGVLTGAGAGAAAGAGAGAGVVEWVSPWGRWLIDVTVWTTVAVTALSGVPYVARALGHMHRWAEGRKRG